LEIKYTLKGGNGKTGSKNKEEAETVSYDLKQDIGLLQLEKQGAERNIVELGYNVMKGTEYFVSL
jgi:hypothetical protein